MKHDTPARAFTLIELMVSIAIIALLISILLPALAGARQSGRRVLALSNARTLGQTFDTYLGQNDDAYPFVPGISDPNFGGTEVVFVQWWPTGTMIGTDDPFMLSWAWPGVVSSIAPWTEHYATWVSPGRSTDLPVSYDDRPDDDREADQDISWRLSNAFLADPKLWGDQPIDTPRSLLRAVRASEVVFPASKVLAWDTHLAYITKRPDLVDDHWDAPTPMVFADGHGDALRPQEASEPADQPLAQFPERKLADTPEGVRGRDY